MQPGNPIRRQVQSIETSAGFRPVSFAEDCQAIMAVMYSSPIDGWSFVTGRRRTTPAAVVGTINLRPDETILVTEVAHSLLSWTTCGNVIKVWKLTDCAFEFCLSLPAGECTSSEVLNSPLNVASSREGALVAACHIGKILIWNSETGHCCHLLNPRFLTAVLAFSPDSRLLAPATDEILVWGYPHWSLRTGPEHRGSLCGQIDLLVIE
ncbi:hypothetical protein BJY04DRAFT_94281 [Aspergillus karnatakaensis]|uniref:uncharacterized protein n=1 Tax=Aspergillus karnatakaensis TaxID=1810916 RepID=UPI003CCDF549